MTQEALKTLMEWAESQTRYTQGKFAEYYALRLNKLYQDGNVKISNIMMQTLIQSFENNNK